jgi:hypothetical protein
MVLQGVNLITAEIVPIEQLIEKIKGYFTLNPEAKINVQNLTSSALEADGETMVMIAQWQKDHGITPPAAGTSPTQ